MRFLEVQTDKAHLATTAEILVNLSGEGIPAYHKTVMLDNGQFIVAGLDECMQ